MSSEDSTVDGGLTKEEMMMKQVQTEVDLFEDKEALWASVQSVIDPNVTTEVRQRHKSLKQAYLTFIAGYVLRTYRLRPMLQL